MVSPSGSVGETNSSQGNSLMFYKVIVFSWVPFPETVFLSKEQLNTKEDKGQMHFQYAILGTYESKDILMLNFSLIAYLSLSCIVHVADFDENLQRRVFCL